MTTTEYRQFIGGEWTGASGGATFEDLDPYSGEVVATVPAGTRADARRAVEAAEAAFRAWSQAPPAERQRVFLAAADILERRADEVVGLLARETGCVTYGFGMFQMGFVPGLLRQAAALAYSPIGQILPADLPGAMAMGLRRPVGVVGAIFPWNAALILSARGIAAPLALGNTVVAKPSEESPFVGGLLWGEIFAEAGLPDGVLNIVTHAPGEAGPIGEELVEHPAVRRINFTGSTATGRTWPRPPAATSSGSSWSWAATTRCWCSTTPTSTTRSTPAPSGRTCTRARSACRPGGCWSTGGSPTATWTGWPPRPPASGSATRPSPGW